MIVETLAVGTELLLGQIVNTNATEIAVRLADAGLDHHHQSVVGDNVDRLAEAIQTALGRADAVIITGGIGPTQDDLTRDAICAAAGVSMAYDDEYADHLRAWWSRRGREMPSSNLKQAEYPDGAERIPNRKGTAPGLALSTDSGWIFAVPGVPAEMLPMIDGHIIPLLQREAGGDDAVVVSRLLRTWGESESRVGELFADLFETSTNPTVAFLASAGEIKIRLTAKAATDDEARALIAPVEAEVRRRMGAKVFGADDETIEHVVLRRLEELGWTLGTAESATGGLISARITAVPGASTVFRGGIVAYATDIKHGVLGVADHLIEEHGVVSEEVACVMASHAADVLGADVVISVTGSAGPDPQERTAGTMIVGVHTPDQVLAKTLFMPGDRERVRAYTTTAALHLARLALTGVWWGGSKDEASGLDRWMRPGGS
ncbi:MAG: competence/damage-inducible protein A [Acidimicrobiia bacterium]|nr:competence/damage-inducible protein A [Acidimicrobiia bacterium]